MTTSPTRTRKGALSENSHDHPAPVLPAVVQRHMLDAVLRDEVARASISSCLATLGDDHRYRLTGEFMLVREDG